jgi:hypothetical protein
MGRQCQVTCALSGIKWESKLSTAFSAYTILMTCDVLVGTKCHAFFRRAPAQHIHTEQMTL